MAEPMLEVIQKAPWERGERLQELEEIIRQGKEALLQSGYALREIRDQELYRPDFDDFDSYCFEKFGWRKRYANRHIAWARAQEKLGPIGLDIQNEAQARQIYPIVDEPEAALEVWRKVGEENGGEHPAQAIRDAMTDLGYARLPEGVEPEEGEELLEGYGEVKKTPSGQKYAKPSVSTRTLKNRVERLNREAEAKERRENLDVAEGTGTDDVRVYHGDFRDLGGLVPDGGVDLVLSDPPYDGREETLELWDHLAEFAARVLKPDGLLVAYTGNYHTMEAVSRVGKHVPWHWQMIVTHNKGKQQTAHGKGFFIDYKPIEIFGVPGGRLAGTQRESVIEGQGEDKNYHRWGQPQGEAETLIKNFTKPGELVCDPFSGGGTVAAASKKLGRRCIAAEIDEGFYKLTVERVRQTPLPAPPAPGQPATVSAIFGDAEPPARSAGTQEARIESVRDALEGVGAEVIVLRPRDIADSGRRLRRSRFSR